MLIIEKYPWKQIIKNNENFSCLSTLRLQVIYSSFWNEEEGQMNYMLETIE